MALALDGLRVIDADTHLTEAHDLWTKRAPAKYAERVPRVKVGIDGRPMWVVDGSEMGFAGGGGVIDREGGKGRALEALYEWTVDEIHLGRLRPQGPHRGDGRLGDLGPGLLPEFHRAGRPGDLRRGQGPGAPAPVRADLQRRHGRGAGRLGQRLLPMPVLPAWDVDDCVAEAKRVAALDLRGVNMTSDPQDVGGPDLANRAWDPLWEVCADLHLPVHFHIGASLTTMTYFGTYPWESQDDDTKLAIGGALLFIGNARVVTNIILSGMLDRHPNLQMVSVESGVGWIPFILEALDYEMSENAPKQLAHMSMLPSEYFKRNLFATFWFEKNNVPALIASVGEDSVLFETDFPHPTCLYPKPLDTVAEKMSELTPAVQRKILGENAAKLYRL